MNSPGHRHPSAKPKTGVGYPRNSPAEIGGGGSENTDKAREIQRRLGKYGLVGAAQP